MVAREWSLTLTRDVVDAGSVGIQLQNAGEDPHNLVVTLEPPVVFPDTPPGGRSDERVSLSPGRYLLFCSLEGHEAAGMSTTLRVE